MYKFARTKFSCKQFLTTELFAHAIRKYVLIVVVHTLENEVCEESVRMNGV